MEAKTIDAGAKEFLIEAFKRIDALNERCNQLSDAILYLNTERQKGLVAQAELARQAYLAFTTLAGLQEVEDVEVDDVTVR